MLTLNELAQLDQLYAAIADDLNDEQLYDLCEQMEDMNSEEKFDYLLQISDLQVEDRVCCGGYGCNYCLMTSY